MKTPWNLFPETFDDLLAAAQAQADFETIKLGPVSASERVVITTKATVDMLQVIDDLRQRVAALEQSQ